MTTISNKTDYQRLGEGAVIQPRPTSGLLKLTGADRSDFLQRMTTNNIDILTNGQSTVTILTSPTARNLFVFTVLCWSDELWLLPAADQGEALSKHLRGQIFFMDKVKVHDLGQDYQRLRLMGAQSASVLTGIGIDSEGAADETFVENGGLVVLKQVAYDLPGYELLIPTEQAEAILQRLMAQGAAESTDEAAYTARRIELGKPLAGYEVTEDYTPLEAGLAWSCAENKGCYTGQEIIARQITYDKVTKTLIGVASTQPLTIGAELTANGRKVGTVTSAGYSPTLERSVGLAIVKRANNEVGSQLQSGDIMVDITAILV